MNREQIVDRVVLNTQHQGLPADRLTQGIAMGGKLVTDGGADQIGPIGVEALLNQKINLAQVDITQVERDLFV
ncbi:hypothetical protein D3C77_577900 [compost metagenome]